MNFSNPDRVQVLVKSMPYIQKFRGKTVVIKYGGNAMINEDLKANVMNDVVLLSLVGIRVVLVHGGGPEINDMLRKLGKESTFVDGLRYTDKETMEIVQMVLCGKVNKSLVQILEGFGGDAIGLCGLDASMIMAQKYMEKDLGYVGEITSIDPDIINDAINAEYIPIIATIAGDENGQVFNLNADTAAAAIASALGAEKLIIMTDTKGVLRDKDDENSLISVVRVSEFEDLKREGIITGGMIPKVQCCVDAINNGVPRTHIIDGRIPHSILSEILLDEGVGTMFI